MIPSHLKLNNDPSKAPELEEQTQTPEQAPEVKTQPTQDTEPSSNSNEFIITEDEFFKQYEGDTKIAADATIDEETGTITVNPTPETVEPKAPLSDSEAHENTELFMRMREGLQSTALAFFVDGNWREGEKYNYPDPQFNKLVTAWTPIIQRSGIRISPWWNVLVTEATCTGPLVMVAIEAHKLRKQRDELIMQNRKQAEKIKEFEQKEIFETHKRSPDSQKKWKLDNAGYFEYSLAGVYIPKSSRSERPNLKADYQLLCKHNGKEFVDKIFKITA